MSAQLPAGAVVQSMADKEAVVLHPITDKSFKTEADLEAFIAAHNTKVSDVVEISRKVLASP